MPQQNRTRDSNGPNTRIRGNSHQIYERYVTLAREAAIEGDRVAVENFYQHAEHYFRISNSGHDGDARETQRPIASVASEPGSTETGVGASQPRWDADRREDGIL